MKTLFLAVSCIALSATGFGQGFYFRAGMGYAVAQAGQTIDATGTPYNGSYSNATNTYKMKGASFGAGVHGYVGAGYMFSKNVGAQLDAHVGLMPKKYTLTASDVTLGNGVQGTVQIEQQATMPIIFAPSIVLQSGGDKWNLYSRMGVALPLTTEITRDEIQMNAPGTGAQTTDIFTFSVQNGFSVGFAGAAGVQYKLNNRMSLWGEVSMLSLSVYAKEAELTAITRNGQSYPLSAVSGNPNVKYSKNVTVPVSGELQPSFSQPFSNAGFNVGIRISRGGGGGSRTDGRNSQPTSRPKRSSFR